MKMNIKALAQQKFKALVEVRFPTETLADDGKPKYDSLKFVGHFRCLSVEEGRKHLAELEALRESGETIKAIHVSSDQVAKFFTGFEPEPGKDMPFVDDAGQPLESNPETIAALLQSQLVREAIANTYQEARSGDVIGKNSKR